MATLEELLKRITRNPAICHGVPVIRNKRYPVSGMLALLASGMSVEEVLADYPGLVAEDIPVVSPLLIFSKIKVQLPYRILCAVTASLSLMAS